MELRKGICVRSKHKIGTQTKIKKAPKDQMNSRFKAKAYTQNQETIKPIKGLLWIDDFVDEHDLTKHIWIQKLKTQRA